jgi:hypothetical protein
MRVALLTSLFPVLLSAALLTGSVSQVLAQGASATLTVVREADLEEPEAISGAAGLTFSPQARKLLVLRPGASGPEAVVLDLLGELPLATLNLPPAATDLVNVTFDGQGQRLLVFDALSGLLTAIPARADGLPDPGQQTQADIAALGIAQPQGLAADATGRLFVLDAAGPRIVRLDPGAGGTFSAAATIELPSLAGTSLRGLAVNPTDGHLHVLDPTRNELHEVAPDSGLVTTRDLGALDVLNPRGLTFAPSADSTDGQTRVSLYIVGDPSRSALSAQLVELSFSASALSSIVAKQFAGTQGSFEVAAADFRSSLVKTTRTSDFSPPSPDPSGIAYIPHQGRLKIVDGEVDEVRIYQNKNVFDTTLSGSLVESALARSNTTSSGIATEPVGVTVDPVSLHLFYSDDVKKRVYEADPGSDGRYHTSDDILTSFDTTAYGNTDPEGVDFDTLARVLFIADGSNNEVYRVSPGANDRFDGVSASGGDDRVTQFDTSGFVLDPEGIAFNSDTGNLYLVGRPTTQIVEVTTAGALVRKIDISAANAVKPAGLTYAPASNGSGAKHIYIVDRNIDNGQDPNENDGRIYEMTLPDSGGGDPTNQPPTVNAGADQTVALTSAAALDGTVTDDGLPNPPAAVTTEWTSASGPGTVTFTDPAAVDTTATFSAAGTYVLRLTASDSLASASDDVTVVVSQAPGGQTTVQFRIATGNDDAEERVNGTVATSSGDLELVLNNEGNVVGNQTVGLRYAGVSIPPGAQIVSANVQFKARTRNSEVTTLTIQGEASDNAAIFRKTNGNISSRLRTGSSVSWSPPAWSTVGEAGAAQRTTDFAAVVQEIVNRPGWTSGNALVLIITGSGKRVADAYNRSAANAPILNVVYTIP